MSDMTPPRPQDVTPGDYDEELWESIAEEGSHLTTEECVECGTPLYLHEANRKDAGKFTMLCDECTYLKLGLR